MNKSGGSERRGVSRTVGCPEKRIPDKPRGEEQVFINKTFWHYDGLEGRYIFVVGGGEKAPAKNAIGYTKIKREEFQSFRKAGEIVVSDWQSGELPAEPDDTGADLI